MTGYLLSFLDYFQRLFRWLGVDYFMMRNIVEVKLMMDNRRNYATLGKNYQSGDSNNRLLMVYGLNALLGGIMSIFAFIIPSVLLTTTILLGYVIAWVALNLISDYSELLLDSTDNTILLPRPVSDRTIWMARLVHLLLYLTLLALSIVLVPTLVMAFKLGLGYAPVFLLLALQATLMAVFLTTLLYMLVVRFSSEERVKDMISYVQIGMSLLFTVGYQILPRLIPYQELADVQDQIQTWHYLVPAAWLGGMMDMLVNQRYDSGHLILTFLAVAVPPLLLVVNTRYLAPYFTQKLAVMGSADAGVPAAGTNQKSSGLAARLADWVTSSKAEKAVFEMSWKLTSRDRRYKMRTYPAFGALVPLLFVFVQPLLKEKTSLSTLQSGSTYLVGIYLLQIIAGSFYDNSYQSDDYRASWLYSAMPLDKPGEAIIGNFKATFLKFFTPFYLLIAVLLFSVWGWKITDDLLAGYFFAAFITSTDVWFRQSGWRMPFSQEPKVKGGKSTLMIVMMLLGLPLFGMIHYGATHVPGGGMFMAILYGGLAWATLKSYRQLNWTQFE
ncbi:hypothetical protein [Siphonobacter sp. SORGH_AS_1065]|uniref:hypothetical protein n=1 Tax=Siphonobacter sp. SORGH_AS_1065 TaxID=3041795 RepID=UPI00278062F8|nr:hypothetical protein [Siphonobacter sp. SORGH_AS_1065]MDQ1088789.1 ABC-2 type transport system permease protein [Siphonobacter sp. SORGH_AS_1065]